jgi:predicted metal-binding membrane protein
MVNGPPAALSLRPISTPQNVFRSDFVVSKAPVDMSSNESAPSPLAALPRRDLFLILGCVTIITALAWLYLFRLNNEMAGPAANMDSMMAMGMSMNMRWTASQVFLTFLMWAVMMVGMMGPSAAPMFLVFAAAQARRSGGGASISAGLFALGYVAVWTLFSAFAAIAQWRLHEATFISESMVVTSARLGGAVLIVAGIYQLSPWKNECLVHCRSPLNFLVAHWRDGKAGALRMGASHGVYCLGCCWALMCVLFSVGVMNLVWVAALAVVVLVEKVAPKGIWIARASGVALIAYGLKMAL